MILEIMIICATPSHKLGMPCIAKLPHPHKRLEKGIPIGVSNSYFMCFNENVIVVKGVYMLSIYDIGFIDS